MRRQKIWIVWVSLAVMALLLTACELPSPSVGDVQVLDGDTTTTDDGSDSGDSGDSIGEDTSSGEDASSEDDTASGEDTSGEDDAGDGDTADDGADSGDAGDAGDTSGDDAADAGDSGDAGDDAADAGDDAGDEGSDESPRPQDDESSDDGASDEDATGDDAGDASGGDAADDQSSDDGSDTATDDSGDTSGETEDDAGEDASTDSSDASAAEGSSQVHIVQAGENLYRIGLQYNVSWTRLAQFNNIVNPNRLIVGQEIKIPDSQTEDPPVTPTPTDETVYVVQPGDNLFLIGLRYGLDWTQIAEANGLVNPNFIQAGQQLKIPADQPGSSPEFTHVVAPGETLFLISLRYGVTWPAIAEENEIESPYVIYVGQPLVIPGGE